MSTFLGKLLQPEHILEILSLQILQKLKLSFICISEIYTKLGFHTPEIAKKTNKHADLVQR